MSEFFEALAAAERATGSKRDDGRGRRWHYVPYDQLTDAIGPLARTPVDQRAIVLVESAAKAARRPYHQQKLATVLASQRHFALEQAARGVRVEYLVTGADYLTALAPVIAERGPLTMMRAAERELRVELAPAVARGEIVELEHEGFLTTADDFAHASADGAPPYRMDRFYAAVRRRTGLLMERGKPRGGKMSFDVDNRRRWDGDPPAPAPPRFSPDAITAEVGALVRERFGAHPGTLDLGAIAASAADVERLWAWAKAECLPAFGPYEDAMSTRSTGLFHSRTSALMHLHRLLPRRVVDEVAAMKLPLACQEGFLRQVIGWREFVRHVHEATDGFRRVPGLAPSDDGAPNLLDQRRPLPPAFWGRESGLACLDRVVREVWREGWGHHITRLMVLSNIASLLDVEPRALTDWFWVAYADAFDWVVEPNVLGMGTFAVGTTMITKPYVSGAGYIHKMSDHCGGCRFDPKSDCPLTPLYWAYLDRHRAALTGNPRMAVPLAALAKRPAERRANDAAIFEATSAKLSAGERLSPDDERAPALFPR
jgi:deoxyribodipyrimidine photolyase-related protein